MGRKSGGDLSSGNPHQLTLNQHVLPRASISRYAGADGCVDCFIVAAGSQQRLRPSNAIFCAKRAWSQLAESGPTTKQVEQDFNRLAADLATHASKILEADEHLVATKFYALLRERERLRDAPLPDWPVEGLSSSQLSQDSQERLEKLGVMYEVDGRFASRMVGGVQIMGGITWAVRNLRNLRWGRLRSVGAQFVIPDRISDYEFLPIGPNDILAANCDSFIACESDVLTHNAKMRSRARRYYFAQDLSCT